MTIAKFKNIPDMKRTVKASGSHFFDPAAMEFFHSKVVTLEYGSYFVTSEYREDPAETKYTARYFTEPETEGQRYEDVTIGEFQAYESVAEARGAIAEFMVNTSRAAEVETLLRSVGLKYEEAASGYMYLRLEDGKGVPAEVFGRGTVLARSGVKLHAPDDVYEIPVGDMSTPRAFAEYVRKLVIQITKGEK